MFVLLGTGLDRRLPERVHLNVTCKGPTSEAHFSVLFTTPGFQSERMTSYYTEIGDVTRSKPTLTWESKPP